MQSVIAREDFEENLLKIAGLNDEFEGYANPHAERIAILSDLTAQKFHLAAHDRKSLRQAALIHDVGERVMNREYIKAERNLTAPERIDMQRHTVIGEQQTAKRGLSRAVQLIVRWHHEFWNGGGYPDALSREQIPLAARILRVADTYAALTDARPFRAAISVEAARKYLTEWAGIEFDPAVVKMFLSLENLLELNSFAENTENPPAERDFEQTDRENDDFSIINSVYLSTKQFAG